MKVPGVAAADAWARGDSAGLGGWWLREGDSGLNQAFWFHVPLSSDCFPTWMGISGSLQHFIAFFEMLAQLCLLVARATYERKGTGPWLMIHACDNTPSVGAIGKGFSVQEPLCFALQAVAVHASRLQTTLQVFHLPGKQNGWADKISRLEAHPRFHSQLSIDREIRLSLRGLLDLAWKQFK